MILLRLITTRPEIVFAADEEEDITGSYAPFNIHADHSPRIMICGELSCTAGREILHAGQNVAACKFAAKDPYSTNRLKPSPTTDDADFPWFPEHGHRICLP